MFKFLIKGLLPLILVSLFFSIKGKTAEPSMIGIIGGTDSNLNTYYLRRAYLDGTIKTVVDSSVLPIRGAFDINDQGIVLIGGIKSVDDLPCAGFIFPNGTVTPLILPSIKGKDRGGISSVALNNKGQGLIGGWKTNESSVDRFPYGAVIDTNGKVSPFRGAALPEGKGKIYSIAIDSFGNGIIGGSHKNRIIEGIRDNEEIMYAAKVAPNGEISELQNPFRINEMEGIIYSVAMNKAGQGVIGGLIESQFYAAIVDQKGKVTQVPSSAFSSEIGVILSVAINEYGKSIIGGFDINRNIYAAFIDSNGNLINFSHSFTEIGMINSVSLNNSGAGVIGGIHGKYINLPYAALVSPTGALISLKSLPSNEGEISSVAMHDLGFALIGGNCNGSSYAALVAPNGTVTELPTSIKGKIDSVRVFNGSVEPPVEPPIKPPVEPPVEPPIKPPVEPPVEPPIRPPVEPPVEPPIKPPVEPPVEPPIKPPVEPPVEPPIKPSIEPIFEELIPKSFGLGAAWTDPLFSLSTTVLERHLNAFSLSPIDGGDVSIVADSCKQIRWNSRKRPSSAFWFSPFAMYGQHKKDKVFPNVNHRIGGALLGFDCANWKGGLIGVAIGYVSQSVHFAQARNNEAGHQKWIALYGAAKSSLIEIEGSLWGGMYKMNHRRSVFLGLISSDSRIKGTIWSPHVKIECPFEIKQMALRPFVQWDWANLWQGPIRERGSSGMNLRINSQYVSLLRSELGCALSEALEGAGGTWHLKQKMSYINKTPFHAKQVRAYYAGADATFGVSLFSNQVEHLAGFSLESAFAPKKSILPVIGWTYQGEWGTKGLTHIVSLELKKEF